MTNLAMYRKFAIALGGLATNAVAQGLLTGGSAMWVALCVGALTAAGVLVTPNG